MSEASVKRYDVGVHFLWATAEKEPRDDGNRIVVMYDDHLAAMEALREAKDREIARLTAICTAAGISLTEEV